MVGKVMITEIFLKSIQTKILKLHPCILGISLKEVEDVRFAPSISCVY